MILFASLLANILCISDGDGSLSRFNKREEDFPSLKEYNDYLEEVEDMSKFFSLGVSYIFDEKS